MDQSIQSLWRRFQMKATRNQIFWKRIRKEFFFVPGYKMGWVWWPWCLTMTYCKSYCYHVTDIKKSMLRICRNLKNYSICYFFSFGCGLRISWTVWLNLSAGLFVDLRLKCNIFISEFKHNIHKNELGLHIIHHDFSLLYAIEFEFIASTSQWLCFTIRQDRQLWTSHHEPRWCQNQKRWLKKEIPNFIYWKV